MAGQRRAVLRMLLVGALIVLAIPVTWYVWVLGPYLAASTQYDRLVARHPKTRADVERTRWFTSHRPIDRSESDYGRHTQLSGRFEQYSVMGAYIDVVYDGDDRVVTILPSFE